jgi:VWFA-related protein
MRAKRLSSCSAMAMWTVVLALAGTTCRRAEAQQEPVFRTSSDIVLVPATVMDRHGRPVSGLKREQFELRVDGKPVQITALDEISGQSTPVETPRQLESNVLTNIPPDVPVARSWVILLVDLINTSLEDRIELRRQLMKFLSKDLRPNQQVAIYALANSLIVLHPFSSDPNSLAQAASRLLHEKGAPPPPASFGFLGGVPAPVAGVISAPPGGIASVTSSRTLSASTQVQLEEPLAAFLMRGEWQMTNFTNHTRAANTLVQFRHLARSFAGVAGKKSVLWLTGDASPLNPTLMYETVLNDPASETLRVGWREIASTYEALNSAGITVYPVDIRGIGNPGLANPREATSHTGIMQSLAQTQQWDQSPYSSTTSRREGEAANALMAMQTAAVETGGEVFRGLNELSDLLDRAQQRWSNYYVLSFTPEPESRPAPAYHRIEVKVVRRGIQVLYRRGYTTRPESAIESKEEFERDLSEAGASPVDLTTVPLRLRLMPFGAKDTGRRFLLSIGGRAVRHNDAADGAHYNFSIFIVLKDSRGKVISSLGDKVEKTFSLDQAARIERTGFSYPARLDAPGGETSFARIIVRDNLSGRLGTLTLQVTNN